MKISLKRNSRPAKPTLTQGTTRVRAVWHGAMLAESDETILIEGNHYFPPSSVTREYLAETGAPSTCPWKGEASYLDIVVGDQRNEEAAWFYPAPSYAAAEIRDYVAFWKNVDVQSV